MNAAASKRPSYPAAQRPISGVEQTLATVAGMAAVGPDWVKTANQTALIDQTRRERRSFAYETWLSDANRIRARDTARSENRRRSFHTVWVDSSPSIRQNPNRT